MKVVWGKTSTIMLGLIIASFYPVIEVWASSGVFPTAIAWQTAALGIVLGLGRYAQTFTQKD